MLSGSEADAKAADIAAYLESLKKPGLAYKTDGRHPKWRRAMLFERYGCTTCHRLTDPTEKDELGRLSLFHVAAKMQRHALASFLQSPHERLPMDADARFPPDGPRGRRSSRIICCDSAKGTVEEAQPAGNAKARGTSYSAMRGAAIAINWMTAEARSAAYSAARLQVARQGLPRREGSRQSPRFRSPARATRRPRRLPEN